MLARGIEANMSLYDDLGVGKNASFEEIRSAYRRRARECHPDLGGDREEFERIQNAHDVLADADRRARYDQTGDTAEEPDNHFSELTAVIIAAFDHVLAQAGAKFREHDLIVHTRGVLRGQKRGIEASIAGAAEEMAKLEELVERLKFEGAGPDILSGTLRQRIRNQDEWIRSAEHKVEQIDQAVEYLAAYGFDWRRAELTARAPVDIDFDDMTFEGLPGSG